MGNKYRHYRTETIKSHTNQQWNLPLSSDLSRLSNTVLERSLVQPLKAVVLALLEVFVCCGVAHLIHLW